MVAANLVQLREEYEMSREDGNRWVEVGNGVIIDIWQSGRWFFWAVSTAFGRVHGKETSHSMAAFKAHQAVA